ncbi:fibronectin type III domain-containing protein [uncultured Flavobacterium sp.]|uniref:fibronectin type III domain-containing protein n=1 Tax=uncultured Flavobacterium sp. TaxID=165435 RepID=UPI0025FD3DDC|nr:fibronectin type III domain-containing protein [uncultured Flavobacterium sp.]
MKTKITLLWLLAFLSFIPNLQAQCTSGTQYPIDTYQATTEAGASIINTDARTGQYANVHVLPSKQYTFTSSVDTDYITVTNDTGTQVYASGTTPLDYVTVYNQTVRYYIHQNAQCATTNQFVRTRRLSWRVAPPCLDPVPTGVTNISPISCNINYTEPSTAPYFGYEAYVSTSSATPGFTVPTSDSTTSSIFVTNLDPDTTYHYWLRADCLYRKGAWVYGGTFNTISALVCNSAYYGLHPAATFTPSCTGSYELFTEQSSRSSTYSNIAVVPNTQYSFRTSFPNDFLTITNALGTAVFISGIDEVTWNSGQYSGVVRFYAHDNAQCRYNTTTLTLRSKSVKCVTTSLTCLPPTSLAISNITSNSVRMGWTAPATAPSSGYQIYLVTNNTAPGVTTTPTHTSATTGIDVVSGLTAGVTYYYWVRSNCGTDKSPWASGGSFTVNASLLCNSATNGLYPNATFTPACTGSAEQIATNAWASQYSNVNTVSNRQYTFTSSVFTDYITITNAAGTAVLANGVTPLTWSSNITGVVRYYLHANANCGAQNSNRTKSIQCTAAAGTCGVPTSLAVSNITSNSSRLTWNAPATAPASYDLYIVTTNTTPTANTTATVTSTTAGVGVLSGLAASTTYYYWIRSNCGTAKSAWVSGGNFTTIAALVCNGATNGLYPEATFTPSCTGNAEQIVNNAYAGEYSNVNVVANKQYTFTSSIATDYLTITNAAGTVVLASGVTPLNWASGTTSGVVRYYLSANANCGAQETSRIRSIRCIDATVTTCGLPTSLAVSNITSNSSRLTWNAPATAPASYDLYIVTTNTTPTVNTAATVTSTTAGVGVLSGLAASTTYYYWIRSNCGTTKSAWVSGGNFTTIAALVCNGATNGLYPEATFTPSCTGSAEQIVNNAYAGEYSNVNVAANKQYTFTSSVATDYLTITNIAGTVVLASGVTPLNWSSGTTSGVVRYYLSANANCGAQETSRIRSIKCMDAPVATCGLPSGFAVSNITSNSCRLRWTAPAVAPSYYDIHTSTTNTAPLASAPGRTSSSTADLPSLGALEPSTTYYYWIRSVCGSVKGAWVAGGSFTTNAALVCNGANRGLFPEDIIFLDGAPNALPVAINTSAGIFSKVVVQPNKRYTFASSVATDYLTLTNEAGTVVLASGITPLSWNSGANEALVRLYVHVNSSCNGDDNLSRTTSGWVATLGIDENIANSQLKIYPNPSAGQFTVDTGDIVVDGIMIIDNLGRIISMHKPHAVKTTLAIDGFSDGIYYVKINYQDKNVTKKLVLKKN